MKMASLKPQKPQSKNCTTDWSKCCLCQSEKDEHFTTPGTLGFNSLQKDLLAFDSLGALPLNIHLNRLDNGTGIANTCLTKEAKWHKSCRSSCNNQKVQRKKEQMTHEEQAGPSPKKLRSNASGTETPSNSDADMENVQVKECCIICEGSTEDDLRKSHDKDRMGISMRDCAIKTKNKALEYRLPINNDLVAADVYYHLSCWTTLKNAARAVDRLSSTSKSAPFDPIAIAQLVVMISSNEKEIYKLSSLKAMYETILSNSCQPSKFSKSYST